MLLSCEIVYYKSIGRYGQSFVAGQGQVHVDAASGAHLLQAPNRHLVQTAGRRYKQDRGALREELVGLIHCTCQGNKILRIEPSQRFQE